MEKSWFCDVKVNVLVLLWERSPSCKKQLQVPNKAQKQRRAERFRSQAWPCPGPVTSWVMESPIGVHILFNPLLFLFHLQEEAARILARQPVSVGTCAALKTPTLQWMCKLHGNTVFCPLLSLSWVSPLSNMEPIVVHAIKNEGLMDVPWFARLSYPIVHRS